MKKLFLMLLLAGLVAVVHAWRSRYAATDTVATFHTVPIKRGDLLWTIGATGTVEPEEVVDVGAQVMGLIVEFGRDPRDPAKPIDFNAVVEKDTVLAKIDPAPYEAALDQAVAALESSKANLLLLEASHEQAECEWKRARRLRPDLAAVEETGGTAKDVAPQYKALADSDYDTARANYKTTKANVAVGKAAIRQNEAALRVARTNLGYTTIKSPVRGVILDRRVNTGQTVVASLNAPSLFLIAKDMRRMQVWASVNEADIGRIRVDMPTRFTVDAYPGETFRGKVSQIRLNATMTQNIVTYTVVVTTDNAGGRLLPYLTANVQFEVEERSGVLLVPNTALRWKPDTSQMEPGAGGAASSSEEPADTRDRGCLWVAAGGFVRPLEVVVGTSDGTMTEVSGSGVQEGVDVVVGEQDTEDQAGEEAGGGDKTSNPFLPKLPKGAKPPPGPM